MMTIHAHGAELSTTELADGRLDSVGPDDLRFEVELVDLDARDPAHLGNSTDGSQSTPDGQ